MKFSQKLRSVVISIVIGPAMRGWRRRWAEWRRRLRGGNHVVEVFLELDDPYSYLLSCYLPDFQARFDVDLRLHLTEAREEGFRPKPELLASYAQADCQRLAAELAIPFLDRGQTPPVEHRRALIDALVESEDAEDFADRVFEALALYWRGDSEGVARRLIEPSDAGRSKELIARNQARLAKLGHYNTATMHYGGEWYWGVDRLHYLEERLSALGAERPDAGAPQRASLRQVSQLNLPVAPPGTAEELPPLEFFFSFRSPYSYLAIERTFDIADAFGVPLILRPVLPMVMRGLPVPREKLLYVATDTLREAERLDIPFGKFADPVGEGVERCMATFFYAVGEKREREFIVNAGRAIWADATDVATDRGLRKVTGRTGLFWPDVLAALEEDDWRATVEQNRADMMAAGSWGVPTLRMGDTVVWGQDRLWLMARYIEDQCDTGEGILI